MAQPYQSSTTNALSSLMKPLAIPSSATTKFIPRLGVHCMRVIEKGAGVSSLLSFFLYSSQLAPGYPPAEIGKLVKRARELNALHGITGILVFDGERFTQYIEGPPGEMAALVGKLAKDPRHTRFRQLNAGTNLAQ